MVHGNITYQQQRKPGEEDMGVRMLSWQLSGNLKLKVYFFKMMDEGNVDIRIWE